jgi:FkbM family methyltransferase
MLATLRRRLRDRWWMSRGTAPLTVPGLPHRPLFRVETPTEVAKIVDTDEEAEILGRFLAELRPGDRVFDVGANIGLYAVPAALTVGTGGRVEAFEPIPLWHRRLGENVALNGLEKIVRLHPVALAATEGTATLTMKAIQGSGMASLKASYDEALPAGVATRVEARLVRGAEFAASAGLGRPDVVKIDVEGAEMEVLEGLGNLLDTCRFLLCEVHPRFLDVPPERVGDLLRDRGFSVETRDRRRAEFHVFASR